MSQTELYPCLTSECCRDFNLLQVSLLEKAVQLNRDDASALVHLANAYCGLSYFRYRQKMKSQEEADSVIYTRHYVRYGGTTNLRGK